MELTTKQKLFLKTKAHDLKPVVMIGQKGVTETVITEIITSIEHHELLKIKINSEDREQKEEIAQYIAEQTGSEIVQLMGKNLTLFKQNKKKSKFSLPKDK
ncbi:MAG: ribosome assembly RNA-binding protein YhbY [Ruminobacter sp.]|jgi:RNA-binding protein|nr:ribosome assembly RNA-binding protein YhbY [Ruminobacter sp.]